MPELTRFLMCLALPFYILLSSVYLPHTKLFMLFYCHNFLSARRVTKPKSSEVEDRVANDSKRVEANRKMWVRSKKQFIGRG